MKAILLSLVILVLPFLQSPIFGCHKPGSTQAKKKPGQPAGPTNNGRINLPPGLDLSQMQVVAVPVPADPTTGAAPSVRYVLVPATNGQAVPPGGNMIANPTNGRMKNGQQPAFPTNSTFANTPLNAQPTNGTQGMNGAQFLQQQMSTLPTQQQISVPSQPTAPIQRQESAPQDNQLLVSCKTCDTPEKSAEQLGTQLMQLWTQMNAAPESTVKQSMVSPDPLYRYMAAQAAGARKIQCSEELIGLLSDSSPYVQQAARQSLVQLTEARGTKADFGPVPGASPTQQQQAAMAWKSYMQTAVTPRG